jgi:hypothetical protein
VCLAGGLPPAPTAAATPAATPPAATPTPPAATTPASPPQPPMVRFPDGVYCSARLRSYLDALDTPTVILTADKSLRAQAVLEVRRERSDGWGDD